MRKDTQVTRKRIIDAAEVLFAEQGVDKTSLLEIARAAGQKNRSALQYHFTNKEGLLEAVLDKHARKIAEERSSMLDELEQRGKFSLVELIEALVLPMASQLEDEDGGKHFINIHSQLLSSETHRELRQRRDARNEDTRRLMAMVEPFIKGGDPDSVRARLVLTGCLLIHGLASYQAQAENIPRPVFLRTLVQAIADLLQQS